MALKFAPKAEMLPAVTEDFRSEDKGDSLVKMIDRATNALVSAKTSAEVLDARDMARVAYDAAKSAGRLARAKQAHDSLLAEVYRAQAEALLIESRAKQKLADEYDEAQKRGEVASRSDGDRSSTTEGLKPTAADIGLTHKDIHEARKVRDAEKANPGIAQRALDAMVERGEEPTKAKLNRELKTEQKPAPAKIMDPLALWLWGRLRDFERDHVLDRDPASLLSEMTDAMRDDVRRLSPLVRDFLERVENAA